MVYGSCSYSFRRLQNFKKNGWSYKHLYKRFGFLKRNHYDKKIRNLGQIEAYYTTWVKLAVDCDRKM